MNEKIPQMETIAKTAELFGLSQYFVRKLAVSGKIKAVRIAGRILINVDRFAEYLNNSTLKSDIAAPETINGIRPLQ